LPSWTRRAVGRYSGLSGFAMVRHMCAVELLSYPSPSGGILVPDFLVVVEPERTVVPDAPR
jgi:hypothetical protein